MAMTNISDRLEKVIKKHNARVSENFSLYADECRRQGKPVGEPIDIMAMVEHKREEERRNETEKT
jgi:hypothetical protein